MTALEKRLHSLLEQLCRFSSRTSKSCPISRLLRPRALRWALNASQPGHTVPLNHLPQLPSPIRTCSPDQTDRQTHLHIHTHMHHTHTSTPTHKDTHVPLTSSHPRTPHTHPYTHPQHTPTPPHTHYVHTTHITHLHAHHTHIAHIAHSEWRP